MANFNENLMNVKEWMEGLTRPTLYSIGRELKEMTFENVTQMEQLLKVIYDAAIRPSPLERQLYAEVCDLLKLKSVNETTFKRLLLSKCQATFNLVLDGSVADSGVVEFIGELFNVGIFPGTILTKVCIEKLVNQRMYEKVHALLMITASRLEAEMDESPQRNPLTMQQCLWKLEEVAMAPTVESKDKQRSQNSVELVGELKAARKKTWIPFTEAMRMKRLAEEKYQQVTRKELLEYNTKVDDMFQRLKSTFASKSHQQQAI